METFLLDKKYKAIFNIINALSMTPLKEMAISDLADKLGITKQTVKSYFQTLLDYCDQKALQTFILEDGKVKMIPDTNFNIFDLYHEVIQESIKYQIMMKIFNNPQITFVNLYLDLAISKSSCSRHIEQLNAFFASYHCQINFSKATPLQGDIHQIRFLFYNLLWGLNQDEIIPASKQLDDLSNFLLDFIPEITYMTLKKIRLGFYIFQVSSKHGFYIDVDFTIIESPYLSFDDFHNKLDELGFLADCRDLATKELESRYLYFLCCRSNLLTLDVCRKMADKIAPINDPMIHYFIDKLQDHYQITLRNDETTCLGINLSLFFKEASLFYGRAKTFDLEKLVDIFHRTREKSANSIQNFLESVYDDNPKIKQLTKNFPSLHLYCKMILRIILSKHQYPIKLLVQSSISTLHREALISQIKSRTPFPVAIYSFYQLGDDMPDGIISNWLPDKKYRDVPFFSISLFFTEWNEADLAHFLNRIVAKKLII